MKTIDKRRQKRMYKAENEKELISLWKKKWRLMQGKRSLNKVELPKPERWGYKRFFVIREDVSKSREVEFYKGILNLVQNVGLSRDKKFEYKDYKTKKKMPIDQQIKAIDHREWNKLIAENKLTPKQQSFFEKKWKNYKYGRLGGYWQYEFTKPWVFVHKVQPHYITHRIIIDPQLESELSELENRIERQNLMPKIGKAIGFRNGWRGYLDEKKKLIEKLENETITQGIDEFVTRYDEYEGEPDSF